MSSIPHESMPEDRPRVPGMGGGAAFLHRHLATIGLLLGLVVLCVIAALAMSSELMCRWTGRDCIASPKTLSKPVGDVCDATNDKRLTEGEARERAEACALAQASFAQTTREIGGAPDAATQAEKDSLLAAYKWGEVRKCAAAASACGARDCYGAYISEFGGSSPHAAQAREEQARLAGACRALLAPAAVDGHYLARSQAACGAKPASAMVQIKSGEIAWRYEYGGIVYQWRGTVDAAGAVRASVGDSDVFKAAGRFTESEREATMTYPDCPGGIAMRIVNKIPD